MGIFNRNKKTDVDAEAQTEELLVGEVGALVASEDDGAEITFGDGMLPAMAKPKKKLKPGRIIAIVVVVLLAGWIGVSTLLGALAGPAPTYVQTATAQLGGIEQTLGTTGTLVSGEKVTLYSPVTAPVTAVGGESGSIVQAGEVLFQFDETELERAYRTAAAGASLASLQNQQARNASAQSEQDKTDTQAAIDNLQIQQRTAEGRVTETGIQIQALEGQLAALQQQAAGYTDEPVPDDLQKQLTDTQQQLAQANLDLATHQNDYAYQSELLAGMKAQNAAADAAILDDNARAQLNAGAVSPQVALESAKDMLETARGGIAAPITGVVTNLTLEPGALASQYSPMCTIESITNVVVELQLSRYDLENVRVGQSVTVTSLGNSYEGTVEKIDSVATQQVTSSGNTTGVVGATVRLHKPDENITLGLDATVSILTGSEENAVLIPISAVNSDVDGSFCYIMEEGIALRRDIVLGISSTSVVQVVSGINAGDEVILSSQSIAEGMAVSTDPQYDTGAGTMALFG